MACWFNPNASSGNLSILTVDNNTALSRFSIQQNATTSPARRIQVAAFDNINSFSYVGAVEGAVITNQWQHAVGTFNSSGQGRAYLNGSEGIQLTGSPSIPSISPIGINSIHIGVRYFAGFTGYWNGRLADVGIWNVALTAAEIASLAKGITCDKIRPQSLVFHAPLVRDLIDTKGGLTITNNNGATVTEHPRIYG